MKWVSLVFVLVCMCGCGMVPSPGTIDCHGNDNCSGDDTIDLIDTTGSTGALSQPTTSNSTPIDYQGARPGASGPSVNAAAGPDALPTGLPGLGPFASSLLIHAPEYLSAWLDQLALDLISPAPSLGDFTYLELLCIARGEPEFLCRQRYGP